MSNRSKKKKQPWLNRYSDLSAGPVDSWMTSYGDLMTILLVFFVLLISATHVSALKFERIKRAFQGATEEESIAMVLESLEKKIEENQMGEMINIEADGNSIQISFHDRLLFDMGKAKVKPEGQEMLKKFGESLSGLPNYARLAIEGYTDDNPVNPRAYDSNWHLSALRSLSVLEILENLKICRENCEIRGFGEFRPSVPNRDKKGKAIAKNQSENRRVVLRIF
jgi:chemotaxis protein MotB